MKHEHVMKIDGKEVSLSANETISILEAAHSVGIEIPKLCSCKELGVKGNCRVCMVEVKGKGLSAACSTQAAENMIVETNSPLVIQHRKNIIELILANHNRNCQPKILTEQSGRIHLSGYNGGGNADGTD